MKKTRLVLVLMVLLLGACATGRIGKIPLIEDKPKGEVTVIRTSSLLGAANSFIITLNEAEIFGIRIGQHTRFKLNEGEYQVGVKCFGAFWHWQKDSQKLNVSANSQTYFLISPGLLNCATIKPISAQEAQKELKNSEYVSMDK